MLEKLTSKLCNISLSNEHLEITILMASFSLKAADKIVANSDCNRMLHNIKKEQLMIEFVCKTLRVNGFRWSVT